MLQLIGLMIGVYTITRMIQIPLEMANTEEGRVFGMPDNMRLWVVLTFSAGAGVLLFLLTIGVLMWSASSITDQVGTL